mgnify:CR=1 FL=1
MDATLPARLVNGSTCFVNLPQSTARKFANSEVDKEADSCMRWLAIKYIVCLVCFMWVVCVLGQGITPLRLSWESGVAFVSWNGGISKDHP